MHDVSSPPLSIGMPTDLVRFKIVGKMSDREELAIVSGFVWFDAKPGDVLGMSSFVLYFLVYADKIPCAFHFLSHERFSLFVVRPSSAFITTIEVSYCKLTIQYERQGQ
jgi:hypothetical protein